MKCPNVLENTLVKVRLCQEFLSQRKLVGQCSFPISFHSGLIYTKVEDYYECFLNLEGSFCLCRSSFMIKLFHEKEY